MKLSIIIPVMNGMHITVPYWCSLLTTIRDRQNTEVIVIDNASTDNTGSFLGRYILPRFPHTQYIRNEVNKGFPASCNQGWQKARGDLIAILHNDVCILDHGWDVQVREVFDKTPELGLGGFIGALSAEKDGGRSRVISNALDAEDHGKRIAGCHACLLLDSLCMIARRKDLEEVGGLDEGYSYNHFSDKDLSMAFHSRGKVNLVIGVSYYHWSGVTSCSPQYRNWVDEALDVPKGKGDDNCHSLGLTRYLNKWGSLIPKHL